MEFKYSDASQRSPEWFKLRLGKVTASRLEDWLSVSKAKGKEGEPLKARLDYEKELQFERQFNTTFEKFVSGAMQDGMDYEYFARKQYEEITGNMVKEVGCYYCASFVASPDGEVTDKKSGEIGLVEIKILKDTNFVEVLNNGVLPAHYKQIQGQLLATGYAWCDYVAVNLNTKKIKIVRVVADKDVQEEIVKSLNSGLSIPPFNMDDVYSLTKDEEILEKVKIIQNMTEELLEESKGLKGINRW